jgi:hypothetical protein
VASLRVSEEQAREACFRFQREAEGREQVVALPHRFLVGDDYVFSVPCKVGVSLHGFYVNGQTGEVRWDVSSPDEFIPTGQIDALGWRR